MECDRNSAFSEGDIERRLSSVCRTYSPRNDASKNVAEAAAQIHQVNQGPVAKSHSAIENSVCQDARICNIGRSTYIPWRTPVQWPNIFLQNPNILVGFAQQNHALLWKTAEVPNKGPRNLQFGRRTQVLV
jgi:type IV secretory pathway VirB9-like protein